MSILALFLLMQIRVAAPDPPLPPSDPTAAFALFQRLCFVPFPDPSAFDKAMAAEGGSFVRWQPSTEPERLIPARVWHSPRATVSYTSHAMLPRDLPDPQCRVRVGAAPDTDVERLFPSFASALGLGKGRIVGKRNYRTGMWDIVRPGQKWRVILGSERRDGRLTLNLTMLNLRR